MAELRSHLQSLDEDALRIIILEFCMHQGARAGIVHGTGEHGIDVLAYVDSTRDRVGKGYNVLIQVKKGDLSLTRWRNEVLGQLFEATYYPVSHQLYTENHARRVVLVVIGAATGEVRNSIRMFNIRHEVTLEVYELEELIQVFEETGFASSLLDRIRAVGIAEELADGALTPPVVGEAPERGLGVQ